ncbi:MAG: porphobilinogen synthase [Gemmatimonadaceae bacterium]
MALPADRALFDAPPPPHIGRAGAARPRRLRRTAALRALVAETSLNAGQLVHPLFVLDGHNVQRPVASLPGHVQLSVDRLGSEIAEVASLGIPAIILFGIPAHKDAAGSSAWDSRGPVPRAIAAIKQHAPEVLVIADVCLCEYTSHGHCGVVNADLGVDNDATLALVARTAVAYADAGADIVAPSAMMDGQVATMRTALDAAGHSDTAILAYAVKYASAFYGPFREAAGSTPAFGDRRSYQMDPPNVREALREAVLDEAEGADMLMVKPAGPYLDVIAAVRAATQLPLAAYQVSGEYATLKAGAERGWIDGRAAALESIIGIRRAGADIVITYFAKDVARWLAERR